MKPTESETAWKKSFQQTSGINGNIKIVSRQKFLLSVERKICDVEYSAVGQKSCISMSKFK